MPRRDPLDEYRRKRSPGKTPEPFGGADADATAPEGGVFVVHKHDASRLHYDLRLELGGVLLSWAVPKGPSLDPADKRLAVHVEDHPLDYADFEGVIPEGQYGAGPIILWDRGAWRPIEDPVEGLEKGKLLFELRGHKLRGVWTLVKLAKGENEWLLIREKRFAGAEDEGVDVDALPPESVVSGLTVEELAEGRDPTAELADELDRLEAPRRSIPPSGVRMMLARSAEGPFSKAGWLFEPKLDGYRMLAGRTEAGVELVTRNGNDALRGFPELAHALKALPFEGVVLDGEVVVHDDFGRPSFGRLQRRALLKRPADVARAARQRPATFYAFDLLAALGRDLRRLPLVERKRLLRRVLPPTGPLRYVEHVEETGEALYARAVGLGFEGIVGKKADAAYRGGRSASWIKVRAERTDDFVVVGWTEPGGARVGFGALHLGAWADGELVYVGRVGTGFDDALLEGLRERLDPIERDAPPVAGDPPTGDEHRWVEPELVAEVRYLERTTDGLLRQPVFVRVRDDKPPRECVLPEATGPADAEPEIAIADAGPSAADVAVSNPDKVFWPDEAYTKSDLVEYYERIGPWLLPYLADRPLVLTRYPDGIDGKSFYQKNAPEFVPDWIRTVGVWSESSDKEIHYLVCDDVATLVYLANLGTIPLHVWASRVGSLDRPDWCILDLDPKDAPFENVVEVARSIHKLCREIGLSHFVKTSGSTGLHVLVPLDGRFDYAMSRTLGELLARVVVDELPKIATVERALVARRGRVYVDYLQNRAGQLLVAPFSVRPLPGAPVSTPLRWREVARGLRLEKYTIRSVPRRVARMKADPMRGVLEGAADLEAALGRLHARLPGG